MSVPPTMDTLDGLEYFVQSSAFDHQCNVYAQDLVYSKGLSSNDNESDYYSSDHSNLCEDDPSSVSSIESSCYEVSKFEAYLYYFGIRGDRRRGPKLIFRTSKDVFTPSLAASLAGQDVRCMQLLPVYKHDELGKDDLWATIRSKIIELLDQQNIKHSSVDLARFSWVDESVYAKDKDNEDDDDSEDDTDSEDDEDDEDIQVEDVDNYVPSYRNLRKVITTPVTIWVGVLPDTLTGKVAFHSSNDILNLLKKHGISDVDVAYRESVARAFSGPELFAPISDLDPLKAIIDPVTTALGLPIAGLKTLNRDGTMGFYFRVDDDLYGITARHVLFPDDEGNNPYTYIAGPKKEVVLMGARAFDRFLMSIQGHIGTLNAKVSVQESWATEFTARLEGSGPNAEQDARELVKAQDELSKAQTAIKEVKKFFVKMKRQWKKPKDRVIGHVVWAPPISISTAPHSYTKDVCVIKLDKKKFCKNFRRNVLNFGPEFDDVKFICSMFPGIGTAGMPSDFRFPFDSLLELRGILSAEEIQTPNDRDRKGDPIRHVAKCGLASATTIGCLTGFESHVRRYFALGSRDSVEAAVYPYNNDSGPFSKAGDSGSIIVDARGKFVALLTSGTGPTDTSDITYGSPIHWLWDIIKAEFPGADLDFEDDNH